MAHLFAEYPHKRKMSKKYNSCPGFVAFRDHKSDGYYFIFCYEIKLISSCSILFCFSSNDE